MGGLQGLSPWASSICPALRASLSTPAAPGDTLPSEQRSKATCTECEGSVTFLGESLQATSIIKLDLRSYGPFKDVKGSYKADPFFPLLVTSVLWALHLSYHYFPRPRMQRGLWVLWQPEGLLPPFILSSKPGWDQGSRDFGPAVPRCGSRPLPFLEE